jgi:FixJ family two-component response regulator
MIMTDLIECIRQTIERHRVNDSTKPAGHRCRCGAEELADHSRHVAQEVVARLGLRPDQVTNVKNEIRYVSAWFDNELTILEGAE